MMLEYLDIYMEKPLPYFTLYTKKLTWNES